MKRRHHAPPHTVSTVCFYLPPLGCVVDAQWSIEESADDDGSCLANAGLYVTALIATRTCASAMNGLRIAITTRRRRIRWMTSRAAQRRHAALYAERFHVDADARTCGCPAGKARYRTGANHVTNGYMGEHIRGAKRECAPCALRKQCLRKPETTIVCQVAFFRGQAARSLHAARPGERERPVAAVLLGAQHRKAHARGICRIDPTKGGVRAAVSSCE